MSERCEVEEILPTLGVLEKYLYVSYWVVMYVRKQF